MQAISWYIQHVKDLLQAARGKLAAALEELAVLREQYRQVQEQNRALQSRIAELEERLNINSRNSSLPPSKNPLSAPKPPKKPPTGRPRGGQPGHAGKGRKLLPMEQVDEVVIVKPPCCKGCGHLLVGHDLAPFRHQIVEIPEIKPHVTEYQLHLLSCPQCGGKSCASLPDGVPNGNFGIRLQAMVVLFTGVYRLSRRTVAAMLPTVFGVEIALGTVSAYETTASMALVEPVAEAREYVQAQPAVNADETSWREGQNKAWLWVAATSLVTVFMIHKHRSTEAAKALLGAFAGILITDRWSAYTSWEATRRQLCWAHLLRDFLSISERGGDAGAIGKALLEQAHQMFTLWHQLCDGALERAHFRRKMAPIMQKVEALLVQGAACSHVKTAGQCRKILELAPALWTFVHMPGVEPTNNAAERAVRPGVLWRKGSFGSDSEKGSRFAERILTVAATCRQQERNVLVYLIEALTAFHAGRSAPSLLPQQVISLPLAA